MANRILKCALYCLIVLGMLSAGSAWAAKQAAPDKPGFYEIGYRKTLVTDSSRDLNLIPAPDQEKGRPIEVHVWHPIDKADADTGIQVRYDSGRNTVAFYGVPTPYLVSPPALDVRVGANSSLPPGYDTNLVCFAPDIPDPADHCSASVIEPLPVSAAGPFPLVVMSHGGATVPQNYRALADYLASHGYIVVAPTHAGDSSPDYLMNSGAVPAVCQAPLPYRPCLDSPGVYFLERPQDVSYMIDRAIDGTLGDDLAAAIDQERIGVAGHSNGGYTALLVAGGLQEPAGDFAAGDLIDPRVAAVVSMSGYSERLPTEPPVPVQNIAAIDVPTMIMYSAYDTFVGIDHRAQSESIFTRLDTSKVGAKYRVVLAGGLHNSVSSYCPAGVYDWFLRGNDNKANNIDYLGVRFGFMFDGAVPPTPDSGGGNILVGRKVNGAQSVCVNDVFYTPQMQQFWGAFPIPVGDTTTPAANLLLASTTEVNGGIALEALPGYFDAGGTYVSTKSSVEVTAVANQYMTAFFNQFLKGKKSERFLNGTAGNAEVEKCQMINGKERCRTTEFESAE